MRNGVMTCRAAMALVAGAYLFAYPSYVFANSAAPQTEVASSTPKDLVFRIFAPDFPQHDMMKRLRGSQLILQGTTDLPSGEVGATLISDPIKIDDCRATCTIPRVPVGQYRLSWAMFKFQASILIPETPTPRLQIRFEISPSGMRLEIIDSVPDRRLNDDACLLIHRVAFENPEPDLDTALRKTVTPFFEEGRPFSEGSLEKAINVINAAGVFKTLRRSDCSVRISYTSFDAVDVTFHLTSK